MGPSAAASASSYPPLPNQLPQGRWSTDLFDCWDDPTNCFITCCCPCITVGQIVEVIDRGNTSACLGALIYCAMRSHACAWLYGGTYRSRLRALFSLPEAPCSDFLLHCCCCLCATCQEYRELKNRGADPSLGWQGNVERRMNQGDLKAAPTVAPRMDR